MNYVHTEENIYAKGISHGNHNLIMIVQCIGRLISGDLFSILIFFLSVCTFVSLELCGTIHSNGPIWVNLHYDYFFYNKTWTKNQKPGNMSVFNVFKESQASSKNIYVAY